MKYSVDLPCTLGGAQVCPRLRRRSSRDGIWLGGPEAGTEGDARRREWRRGLGLRGPRASEWDAALKETDLPLRFSHRAEAGRLLERVYPEYEYEPRRLPVRRRHPCARPPGSRPPASGRPHDLSRDADGMGGNPVVQGGRLAETKIRKIFEVIGGRGGCVLWAVRGGDRPQWGPQASRQRTCSS